MKEEITWSLFTPKPQVRAGNTPLWTGLVRFKNNIVDMCTIKFDHEDKPVSIFRLSLECDYQSCSPVMFAETPIGPSDDPVKNAATRCVNTFMKRPDAMRYLLESLCRVLNSDNTVETKLEEFEELADRGNLYTACLECSESFRNLANIKFDLQKKGES